MMLFEPVHDVEVAWAGTMNFSCLFVIDVNVVTALPHTVTDRPVDELIGKPAPATVA